MSIYIIEPVFTDEMVIRIFKHMELQDGQQDGYFRCLFDLFGKDSQSHDEAMEQVFKKGRSYLEIVDTIVEAELQPTIEFILNVCNMEKRDFGSLADQIKLETDTGQAVNSFFIQHAKAMREAVRF